MLMDECSIYEPVRGEPNEFFDTSSYSKHLSYFGLGCVPSIRRCCNAAVREWQECCARFSDGPIIQSPLWQRCCHVLHAILAPVRYGNSSVQSRYPLRSGMIDIAAILLFGTLVVYTVLRAIKLDRLLPWFSKDEQQPPPPSKKKFRT